MDQRDERQRTTWTTRINVRPTAKDMIQTIARQECMSVATMIGLAIENYVTARSTA